MRWWWRKTSQVFEEQRMGPSGELARRGMPLGDSFSHGPEGERTVYALRATKPTLTKSMGKP